VVAVWSGSPEPGNRLYREPRRSHNSRTKQRSTRHQLPTRRVFLPGLGTPSTFRRAGAPPAVYFAQQSAVVAVGPTVHYEHIGPLCYRTHCRSLEASFVRLPRLRGLEQRAGPDPSRALRAALRRPGCDLRQTARGLAPRRTGRQTFPARSSQLPLLWYVLSLLPRSGLRERY